MRKHLYLITEHPDPDMVGLIETTGRRHPTAPKNEEGVVQLRNVETDDVIEHKVVGLGYADIEESTPNEEVARIIEGKLTEIDERHLEKAGIET